MKKKLSILALIVLAFIFIPAMAFADTGATVDTGDTTFSIISTALVFIMTPGLALFYGGMVRKKNVLNTMMNSFVIIGIITIQWVVIGYTLAFGPDLHGFIGNLSWLGFKGVGAAPHLAADGVTSYASTIPHGAFAIYQMMFAIITPALISGAFAERMRFPAFLGFTVLWATFVYDPLAHWVWGIGGWLRKLGALDFAGGTVVHISSGIAGLVVALVLGKRKGYKTSPMIPHNIPFVVIGAALLWFGWFGFNAGSALSANGIAINALITTHIAAAAALLSWVSVEWFHHGKPTLLGAATGAVIGLVAITPGAGFVTPLSAIAIGLLVSPVCYFAITFVKAKLGYDDALDAFGCHGVGGIWGAIATGIFATKSVNSGGADGLLVSGNFHLLGVQALAVLITIALSAVMTFVILKAISIFTSLRVSASDEDDGLDITQHGEDAYPDITADQSIAL